MNMFQALAHAAKTHNPLGLPIGTTGLKRPHRGGGEGGLGGGLGGAGGGAGGRARRYADAMPVSTSRLSSTADRSICMQLKAK